MPVRRSDGPRAVEPVKIHEAERSLRLGEEVTNVLQHCRLARSIPLVQEDHEVRVRHPWSLTNGLFRPDSTQESEHLRHETAEQSGDDEGTDDDDRELDETSEDSPTK